MDRDFLKKILHDQMEPMDVAVHNKLKYLESDDVFTDAPNVAYTGNFSDSDIGTLFGDAFSETVDPSLAQQSKNVTANIGEGSTTNISRHQIIADKIAALRGICIDSDYMRRKKPDSSF